MRPVDYEIIARTYDDDPIRSALGPDPHLTATVAERGGARVLDVGCGTGLWLEAQARAFPALSVAGVDPSPAMLARAAARLPRADLRVAPAEAIPHPDAAFDVVASRFAYHHFRDLARALDELARVLAPGGLLHLANIVPARMAGAWVFAWFPTATEMNARYPAPEALRDALAERGLRSELAFEARASEVPIAEALRIARVRDQSHLHALDDDAYAAGLAALEAAAAREPERRLPTESTVLRVHARRG
jgi:SAM-dependent methyltransferase